MGKEMKNQSKESICIKLNPLIKEEREKIEDFLFKNKPNFIINEIESQFEELFFIHHPSVGVGTASSVDIKNFIDSFYSGKEKYLFGIWVYYPWRDLLVHFLPEDLHTELRTARNRNLITKEEQDKYYNATVAITGLSVGNSAMANLLYTGGAKNLKLADFDVLSGSNINRIRTGFSNIGEKKVIIAAREIYEVNPYANLSLFSDGATKENLEKIVLDPKIDVLIEEMDNLYLKIQIRLLARKHGIPVIMAADNGDNIVLDIERFDISPHYPILHGDVPEEKLLKISPETPKPEAARIISRWVHPENVASRMKSSLFELGKTLFSWPQLGNAAFLAGCALSYSARKIILNEPLNSGKYQISLDEELVPNYSDPQQVEERQQETERFKTLFKI